MAYPGGELELFAAAINWKRYWAGAIAPYLGRAVLEVGAGIGANTALLHAVGRAWTCVEPDPALAKEIEARRRRGEIAETTEIIYGTIADIPAGRDFDTILYLDVLEHLADDRGELAAAARLLRPKGHLIVLAPAHGWLTSEFDRQVGHVRRYTRASLAAVAGPGLVPERLDYLDSAGLLASLANRLVLRRALPSTQQVALWDRALVPLSRLIDPLTGRRIGKSVLAVWRVANG